MNPWEFWVTYSTISSSASGWPCHTTPLLTCFQGLRVLRTTSAAARLHQVAAITGRVPFGSPQEICCRMTLGFSPSRHCCISLKVIIPDLRLLPTNIFCVGLSSLSSLLLSWPQWSQLTLSWNHAAGSTDTTLVAANHGPSFRSKPSFCMFQSLKVRWLNQP